ncbi:hypothetical protein FRB93_009010 [Tulasnella sp. JGI-2019a]|nr:hypothetical protein FRB93_009010 [Tulasnella sp. JGI-2019a]
MAPPLSALAVVSSSRKRQASTELDNVDGDDVVPLPAKRARRDEDNIVAITATGPTNGTQIASSTIKDQLKLRREKLAREEAERAGPVVESGVATANGVSSPEAPSSTVASSSSPRGRAKRRDDSNPMAIKTLVSPSPLTSAATSKQVGADPNHLESDTAQEIARLRRELATKNALIEKNQETFSALQSSLQCQICYEVLQDPHITPCGHTSCRTCLIDWFKAPAPAQENNAAPDLLAPHLRRKTCPTCRAPVRARPTPVFIVKNVISNLSDFLEGVQPPPTDLVSPPNAIEGVGAAVREDPWAGLVFGGNNDHAILGVMEPPVLHPNYLPFVPPMPILLPLGIIDDPGDRVQRCGDCLYEIYDGACVGCGRVFFAAGGGGGFDDEDDEVEVVERGGDIDDEDDDLEDDDFVRGRRRRHWFFGDDPPVHEEDEDEESDGGSFIDDEPIPQWNPRRHRPPRDYDHVRFTPPAYEPPDDVDTDHDYGARDNSDVGADYGDGDGDGEEKDDDSEVETVSPSMPRRSAGRHTRRPIIISDSEREDDDDDDGAPPPPMPRRQDPAYENEEVEELLRREFRYSGFRWNAASRDDAGEEDEEEPHHRVDQPIYPFSPPHNRHHNLHDNEWDGVAPEGSDDFDRASEDGDEEEEEEEDDDFVPRRHGRRRYDAHDDDGDGDGDGPGPGYQAAIWDAADEEDLELPFVTREDRHRVGRVYEYHHGREYDDDNDDDDDGRHGGDYDDDGY